jgi:hypothetical protein
MAIISFPNQVLDPNSVTPSYIPTQNYSLSASGKNVDLISAGSNIELVTFNDTTIALTNTYATLSANATPNSQTLSAANAVRLRVDRAYNGVQFAVVYKDRSSSLFTAATATQSPNGQTLTDNGFETVSPNLRRLVNLGY